MVELKPCPFCGGEAYIDNNRYEVRNKTLLGITYFVRCSKCQVESFEYHSKADAVKAWNRRANNAID